MVACTYPQPPEWDDVTSCFKYLEPSAKINPEFAPFIEYFITAIGNNDNSPPRNKEHLPHHGKTELVAGLLEVPRHRQVGRGRSQNWSYLAQASGSLLPLQLQKGPYHRD